jgi:hypothetical protein
MSPLVAAVSGARRNPRKGTRAVVKNFMTDDIQICWSVINCNPV